MFYFCTSVYRNRPNKYHAFSAFRKIWEQWFRIVAPSSSSSSSSSSCSPSSSRRHHNYNILYLFHGEKKLRLILRRSGKPDPESHHYIIHHCIVVMWRESHTVNLYRVIYHRIRHLSWFPYGTIRLSALWRRSCVLEGARSLKWMESRVQTELIFPLLEPDVHI